MAHNVMISVWSVVLYLFIISPSTWNATCVTAGETGGEGGEREREKESVCEREAGGLEFPQVLGSSHGRELWESTDRLGGTGGPAAVPAPGECSCLSARLWIQMWGQLGTRANMSVTDFQKLGTHSNFLVSHIYTVFWGCLSALPQEYSAVAVKPGATGRLLKAGIAVLIAGAFLLLLGAVGAFYFWNNNEKHVRYATADSFDSNFGARQYCHSKGGIRRK